MSDPSIEYADKRYGAICEIISAISALNMHPEAIAEPEGDYLSDKDRWAKHAVEHLEAAVTLLRQL